MQLRKRFLPIGTKVLFAITLVFAFLYTTSLYMLKYSDWPALQSSSVQHSNSAWQEHNLKLVHDVQMTRLGLVAFSVLYVVAFISLRRLKAQPDYAADASTDDYSVKISHEGVTVTHRRWPADSVSWKELHVILLVNTDEGPWLHDIWLTLIGNNTRCMIPRGSKGFDEVYKIVSKYEGFDFDNFRRSMNCTNNAEFLLWTKKRQGGITSLTGDAGH